MLNNIKPEVNKKVKRIRHWIIVLGILLVIVTAVALIWHIRSANNMKWVETFPDEAITTA